jgi:hypothetical protein
LDIVEKPDCGEIDVGSISDSAKIYMRFFLKERMARRPGEMGLNR